MKVKNLIVVLVSALMIVALALAMMPAMVAHAAATEVVDSTSDSGAGSLREAIADVDPGGTITFNLTYPATITLTSGELLINKNLTITGPGAADLTISGNNNSRVFNVSGGTTVVIISGVTIENGLADNGGGIYNEGDLTLNNVTVTNNSTENGGTSSDGGDGGGIYNEGTLTLNDVIVSGNSTGSGGNGGNGVPMGGNGGNGGSGGDGGGIFNSGTLTLTNTTVSGNSTGSGGDGGHGDDVPLYGDSNGGDGGKGGTGGDGGGIFNSDTLTLTNSTVSDNSTGLGGTGGYGGHGGGGFDYGRNGGDGADGGNGGDGGGVYNGSTLTLTNSTLSGNSTGSGGDGGWGGEGGFGDFGGFGGDGGFGGTGGFGGGVYNGSTLTLTNSTLSGNSTGLGGTGGYGGQGGGFDLYMGCGGWWGLGGDGGFGGGIYNDGGLVEFKSTIIAGNTAAVTGPDCAGTLTSYGCNLVGERDSADCPFTPGAGDQVGTGDDPIDPLLGPLQDNGGPTETHALLLTSPAIDAVSDECGCTTIGDDPVTTDQRGEPRPMDGDGDDNLYCDIGAYEAPLHPYKQGFQDGLKACSKVVGGAIEPVDLSELSAPSDDGTGTHIPIVLWIGLASAVAVGGGLLLLRRRRAH